MKPMLAFKFQDKHKQIVYPCYIQPKLNGVRMLYRDGTMQSHSRALEKPKFFPDHRLQHLREELSQIPSHFLVDGELYLHGWSLQQINSAVGINRNEDSPKTALVEYHIFDIIDTRQIGLPFFSRSELLTQLQTSTTFSSVNFVETAFAPTEAFAESYFVDCKRQGYEGAIYRAADASYGLAEYCTNKENRWSNILKRKDWLDINCLIVSFETTIGTKGEKGFSMGVELENGVTCFVGSGLSDMEVLEFEKNPPIGGYVKLKFEAYSDSGTPLKPSIESIL